MRLSRLLISLSVSWAGAFSFNAYDLGLYGLYPRRHFQSVNLEAPALKTTKWDSRCDSGNIFLTPRGPWVTGHARGPIILDARGELIWMDNNDFEQAMNLNVQSYKGEEYLTFWTKSKKNKHKKHSKKSYVMLNSSYEVVHRITPHGKGLKGDSHEFRITPQGTALITIYHKHQTDCTKLGVGESCWIQDGLFQEIDIETGKLLFEWRATDHISMHDVFSKPCRKDGYGTSKQDAFDFFHINSVDKIESGDYVISARYMHAVVCISGKTGEILWQLGGKNNNFRDLNTALDFAWQHHVTWQGNNTISIFDNHANSVVHSPSSYSKGMVIQLDLEDMTASLVQKYIHPDKILNVSQGSVQILPESGNVLVGFGNSPTYVEYSAQGDVLCNTHFAPHIAFEIIDFGLAKSYRVFKHPWIGRPNTTPDVKIKHGKAYVSWNGATEVTGWRLETARGLLQENDDGFVTAKELSRDGFETSFALEKAHGYVRLVALDANNKPITYSQIIKVPPPSSKLLSSIVFLCLVVSLTGALAFLLPTWKTIRVPRRMPRLSQLRSRWYTATRKNREFDAESEPLLLDVRDP
ncbi:hypothetical protein LTR84_009181 [Exophiala bonariae]|uniref:Arylsulfotransferase n=1 Tax=Exophiala bonariae TaxID=1690606 RepID=A0AAV9MV76_9EURO|nr:hypothetical protein LTR84_009181 [Exophiala bonariae]